MEVFLVDVTDYGEPIAVSVDAESVVDDLIAQVSEERSMSRNGIAVLCPSDSSPLAGSTLLHDIGVQDGGTLRYVARKEPDTLHLTKCVEYGISARGDIPTTVAVLCKSLPSAPVAIVARAKGFCDQGWGHQKGAVLLALLRHSDVKARLDLFGLAPHRAVTVSARFAAEDECAFLRACEPGDRVVLQLRSGGGSGRALNVDELDVELRYVERGGHVPPCRDSSPLAGSTPLHDVGVQDGGTLVREPDVEPRSVERRVQDGSLRYVGRKDPHTLHLTNCLKFGSPAHGDTPTTVAVLCESLTSEPAAIVARAEGFYVMGRGNQKGVVLLTLLRDSDVKARLDLFGLAPQDVNQSSQATTVSARFATGRECAFLRACEPGDRVVLQLRVGGGHLLGARELDVELKYYIERRRRPPPSTPRCAPC